MSRVTDPGSSWDRRAFAFDRRIADSADPFVRLVEENVPLSRDFTELLDIGCGSGTYALPFAGRVRSVKGVDVSPEMIRLARSKAEETGASNADFSVVDWDSADVSRLGRFNLTFAHMTPAVHDGSTFAKMLSVSSGWCFLAGYIARESRAWDEIYSIIGEPEAPEFRKLTDAQETLWRLGKVPHLAQFRRRMHKRWDPADAEAFYVEAVRSFSDMDGEQEDRLRRWVREESSGGVYEETSHPVIGVLYWDMADSA